MKRRPTMNLAAMALCVVAALSTSSIRAETAREILDATGVRGGLIVHLGCGDGKLTAALHDAEAFLVHGLDAEPSSVAAARQHIRSLGLYGEVSVEQFAGPRLPYADNLVTLLVAENSGDVDMGEVMRVLSPLGVAYVKQGGRWTKTVKPRPEAMDDWTHFRHAADGNMVSQDRLIGPPRYLQWVCGPRFQRHHGIVPSITTVVSSGGRMFYQIDEAPLGLSGMPDQWKLVARDAANGVLLWKRPMADWGSRAWSYWTEGHAARFNHPPHVRKRLVAQGDRVYATLGFNAPIEALDAATGETVISYAGTQFADEFVLHRGVLYAAINDRMQEPWPGEGVDPAPPTVKPEKSKKHIWAIEGRSGKVLWKAGPLAGNAAKPDRLGSMRHLNLTVGAKAVFAIDEREIVALDMKTGKTKWRSPRLSHPEESPPDSDVGNLYHKLLSSNTQAVICHGDTLYVMHPKAFGGFKSAAATILQALSAETGEELWRHDTATPIAYLDHPDLFGIGDTIWIPDRKTMTLIALDTTTGEEKRALSIKKALDVGHHHRCYPNRASVDYAVLGRRGAEFVDLATGEITLQHWARSGCRYGHLLANGLTYRLPDHCRCYMAFQPRGFLAMAAKKAAGDFEACLDGGNPLEEGPAYDTNSQLSTLDVEPSDWPTFRHDAMRSSAATTRVPTALRTAWQAEVGARLTAPVVAGGRVFCATADDHQVHAIDAATGNIAWSFTAAARIDSPPTIVPVGRISNPSSPVGRIANPSKTTAKRDSKDGLEIRPTGLCLFGCRDGRVYCLRADDGRLVWRFRAAPGERRIVAFGQIESAWPVSGSVLVVDNTAYFAAGRASVLDGGMVAYAVEVATGKLLGSVDLHDVQTDTRTTGSLPEGALADILTCDGQGIYLGRRKLDLPLPEGEVWPAELSRCQPLLTADGGLLSQQWFHRAFWNVRSSAGKGSGNLIAFDPGRIFVAAANGPGNNNKSFHIPAGGSRDRLTGLDGRGPSWCANPNLQYGGCLLFAATKQKEKDKATTGRPGKPKKGSRPAPAQWRIDRLPIMPWAMVADGQTLFVAGPPDKADADDPWAAFEGRRGGRLFVIAADSGKILAEHKLDAPPVFNGMAAARGRLFVSTVGGRVTCFGGP